MHEKDTAFDDVQETQNLMKYIASLLKKSKEKQKPSRIFHFAAIHFFFTFYK